MTVQNINKAIERSVKMFPNDMSIQDILSLQPAERIISSMQIPQIKVKYHNKDLIKIKYDENGNFFDLRAAKRYEIKKGDFALIDLGVSIKLPEGYWGQVVPRSSLFKNHKVIQANSFGVIDTTYCGEDDHWMLPVLAFDDTVIEFNERICQFRIVKDNPFTILEVDNMEDASRGGFGTSGTI